MALPKKEIIPLPFALFSPGSPPPALGLVGEQWSSFSGAAQVLWFVVLTKPTLLTPQSFTHCPAGLAQQQGLFHTLPPQRGGWGGETLGGTHS